MSTFTKNKAIKQFGSPGVLSTKSEGHTTYISFLHVANICGVITAKNCLFSATAMYEKGSSTIMNLLIAMWKNGKEWTWYSSEYLSAAFKGISIKSLMLSEVATACTVAIV
jgi:hypothetical protein